MSRRQLKFGAHFLIPATADGASQVAMEQSGASAMDLFNGVTTHFLSECPGVASQEHSQGA